MAGIDFSQDPVGALFREYERRKRNNPLYSQRAFARVLGVPSGRLSELFGKRRALTAKLGAKVADRLAMPPEERARFFVAIEKSRAVRKRTRRIRGLAEETVPSSHYHELKEDVFATISDWPHYAVLNLMETVAAKSDCRWLATRLGLPAAQMRDVVDRLLRLGLLKSDAGKWTRTSKKLSTAQDIPSGAVRRWHQQCLTIAEQSLETVAVEKRDITSTTFPVDPKNLKEAKRLIKNFRRGLAELLADGHCREVYNLTVALYPLTKESHA